MIALLRKDGIWLGTAFLLGLLLWSYAFFDAGVDWWWIGQTWLENTYLLGGWIFAGGLGLYVGLRDRLLGTREYLLQRPVGARAVFWTRTLACVGLLLVVTALPPLLSWILPSQNKAAWAWSELGLLLAVSTSLVTVFSLATYATTINGSASRAVTQAAIVGVPVFLVSRSFLFGADPLETVSPLGFAAKQLALSAPLLVLAGAQFARGQDEDRPEPPLVALPNALLLAGGAVFLLSMPLSDVQGARQAPSRHREHKVIVDRLDVGGGYVPLSEAWPEYEHLWAPRRRATVSPDGHTYYDRRRRHLGPFRTERTASYGHQASLVWAPRERTVRLVALNRYGPEDWDGWATLLVRGDGTPFSARTVFDGAGGQLFAWDRADDSLWRTPVSKDARFLPVARPTDDPLVRIDTRAVGPDIRAWEIVLETDQEAFAWREDSFEPVERSPRQKRARPSPMDDVLIERTPRGPFATHLRLSRDGDVLEDTVLQMSDNERLVIQAMTILCAPVLNLASFDASDLSWPLDPVVFEGRSTGLVMWGLALALALAVLGYGALRTAGTPRWLCVCWSLLTLLGGLACWLVLFHHVRQQRPHRSGVPRTEPAPMLVQSPSLR